MRNYVILGAALSAVVGCAPFPHTETPLATNFPTSTQRKLQAAHHWDVIASDMAQAIADALAKGNVCSAPAGACPTIHVEPIAPYTVFGQAFHNQLVSHLVSKGLNVVTAGPGEITVRIDTQAIKFSPERKQYLGVMRFTQIAVGLWALYDIPSPVDVLAGAMMADVYDWNLAEFAKGPTPQVELLVTVSATRGNQFVARRTHAYYIADTDASLYTPPPLLHTIHVVGDAGGAAK